jgi:NTP pyrophosphatase (non-canonical NTP hydrolase)
MSKGVVEGRSTATGLQKHVADYVERNDMEVPAHIRCLDLVCEVGELTKELLERTEYGRKTFRKSRNWADEFGDVVFALFCLANSTEVDVEEALLAAVDKYSKRVKSTGSASST